MSRIGLPSFLHFLGEATRLRPMVRFARAADHPERTQRDKLVEMLRRNAGTDYGRAHGFSSMLGSDATSAYARNVPIVTPADVRPWVDRTMAGERNVLTADAPVYYTRTTGSGGAPKHVPITPSYRIDFQKTVHVALGHLYLRFPAAFLGRALYFVGTRHLDRAPDGNDIGTMSGFNFTELPPLLRGIYAWPYELFEVADLATRSYLALSLSLVSDVSLVAGIFPAPVVYLLRDLEARGGEIAHDLSRGTLPSWLALTPAQRAFFSTRLTARPDVARRLTDAFNGPADELVARALPMLRLVYCWTTATAALYLPELRRRLGPTIAVRDAIYSATEGWATIPIGEEAPGGPVAIESGYWEFIPEDAYARGSRDTVGVADLEDGRRYLIVVTTATGLYRYLLGDVVEACGKYRNTPRIRFVRRDGATCNLVGENLDETHVTHGVSTALAALDLEPTWFSMGPRPPREGSGTDRPGYQLFLELPIALTDERLESLRARIDEAIMSVASDYRRNRAGNMLAPLTLHPRPIGTYHRWRQDRLSDGSAEAQLKTAHLVGDISAIPQPLRA